MGGDGVVLAAKMRREQTKPMSVGSAFDAFIKSKISLDLIGTEGEIIEHTVNILEDGVAVKRKTLGPKFNKELLFLSQVDATLQEEAWQTGEYCCRTYIESGAYGDLVIELERANGEIRMEASVMGTVGDCVVNGRKGVPLLGKPDLVFYVVKTGQQSNGQPEEGRRVVVVDWKINGYYGKGNTSPTKEYIRCNTVDGRDVEDMEKGIGGVGRRMDLHKGVVLGNVDGLVYNMASFMNEVSTTWADQLTIYGWLMGAHIGERVLVGIEQAACKANPICNLGVDGAIIPCPDIRWVAHRCFVDPEYQMNLVKRLERAWTHIQTGQLWPDLSVEACDRKMHELDEYAATILSDPNLQIALS